MKCNSPSLRLMARDHCVMLFDVSLHPKEFATASCSSKLRQAVSGHAMADRKSYICLVITRTCIPKYKIDAIWINKQRILHYLRISLLGRVYYVERFTIVSSAAIHVHVWDHTYTYIDTYIHTHKHTYIHKSHAVM